MQVVENVVLIKSQFTRGGFPSERVFQIKASGEGVYRGIAPQEYCYSASMDHVVNEPGRGERIDGFLVGISIGAPDPSGRVRVYLPDSNVYEIDTDLIEEKRSAARVPVQS